MVPYGLTVFGLGLANWQAVLGQDDKQITVAATQWCTNYVRLQIAPASLLAQSPYDAAFLQAIESEVALALSYDQNVVLTAQTEKFNNQSAQNPTEQSIQFWQVLAPIYMHNPRVWFDVFNEPRLSVKGDVWDAWQNGATVTGQTYVGMQQLVDAVRNAAGPSNLIVVEGPHDAGTLDQLPAHLINGVNIVYSVHPFEESSPSQWNENFGEVAESVPVIVGAWTNYDSTGRGTFCQPSAPTYVPEFLSYLRQRQIGLGGWALIPGVLVTNTTTFTPTQLTSTYACDGNSANAVVEQANSAHNGNEAIPQAQGVGQLMQNYFREYARL